MIGPKCELGRNRKITQSLVSVIPVPALILLTSRRMCFDPIPEHFEHDRYHLPNLSTKQGCVADFTVTARKIVKLTLTNAESVCCSCRS